jgi:hypothetical protein
MLLVATVLTIFNPLVDEVEEEDDGGVDTSAVCAPFSSTHDKDETAELLPVILCGNAVVDEEICCASGGNFA